VSGIDDAVVSTKQYTDKDYFRMLIAKNMGKKLESESEAKEVETVYNKFIDLFNEAVVKAHENA
jgi:exonuclease SbcD